MRRLVWHPRGFFASIKLMLIVTAETIGAERGVGAFILTAGNLM